MIEKITLPNGARLLTEYIDHVRSAALGFWVGNGSRHEPERLGGISHAIEHMLFKGTATRTAAQIAEEIDAIGGQVNAFTTKECTCYYGRALDSHMDSAIELMSDMFFNARIAEEDWQMERGVILEEIGMYEDAPEDLVGEELFGSVYRDSPLGRPILGKPDILNAMTARDIAEYKDASYTADRLVVSLAGHFSEDDKKRLCDILSAVGGSSPATPFPGSYSPAFTTRQKPIEQNHLCIAFPSLPLGHPDRFTLQVLSAILGSGMSSRLVQTVREQNGLCYSIYSYTAAHADTGLFGIYTALGKETEAQAIGLICDVVRAFKRDGPTEAELSRTREQIKANVLMGLESTSARMQYIGQNEILSGRVPTPEEIAASYDQVTLERVNDLSSRIFDFEQVSFSAVGNVESTDYRELIMQPALR